MKHSLCVAAAAIALCCTAASALQCREGKDGTCKASKYCYKFQGDQGSKKIGAKRGCGDIYCSVIGNKCKEYKLPIIGTKGSICCCKGDMCNSAVMARPTFAAMTIASAVLASLLWHV